MWDRLITKILSSKKINYQNLENPNPWVDGGGIGYIPITSISLFFSIVYIFSKEWWPNYMTIHLYICKIKKNVCYHKKIAPPPPHAPHPLMLRAWCLYIVVSLSLLLCSKIEFTQFPSLLNFYLKHALKWSHANNSQKFRPALNFFIRVDWSFYKNFDNVIYSEIKTSKLTLIYVACGMVGSLIKRTIEHLHCS